jgi:hypothetical protein
MTTFQRSGTLVTLSREQAAAMIQQLAYQIGKEEEISFVVTQEMSWSMQPTMVFRIGSGMGTTAEIKWQQVEGIWTYAPEKE